MTEARDNMQDDEESVVGTLPPPRKSDVLFGSGTDWQVNACINGIDEEASYQDGYRRAALHLADYVCDTAKGQDFLVYPIVYLYRHHIELRLKSRCGAIHRQRRSTSASVRIGTPCRPPGPSPR
jgi:hypothetical protein